MTAMPADIFGPIFRKLLAQAWEQGRCAAARGVKNNPYINQTEEASDARA